MNEEGLSGFTTRRVANQAGTSVPAVYELFRDKSGLLRSVFFEGFRMLALRLLAVPETDDAVADVPSSFRCSEGSASTTRCWPG